MSEALYNSLQLKWSEYLEDEFYPIAYWYTPEEVTEEYDHLVVSFCEKHDYSEKTKEFAFHGQWYDTFADMYYQKLEGEGVVIIPSVTAGLPNN